MKITLKVKLNKTKEGVEKIGKDLVVFTKQPAKENKANLDIIRQLASHLKVSKSSIGLKNGATSKTKVFEIK